MAATVRERFVRILCGIAAGLIFAAPAHAQQLDSWDGAWVRLPSVPPELAAKEPWVRPNHFGLYRANLGALRAELATAPLEFTREAVEAPLLMSIPMPTGEYAAFEVVESPIMEPGLQRKFPEIKTYLGQGIDDPTATVRLDLTPQGFHAQILSPNGRVMVDPYNRGDSLYYASYYAEDNVRRDEWHCDVPDTPDRGVRTSGSGYTSRFGETLRTYRLANAATGEYVAYHGGTVPLGMAAITTAINRVTGVYEQEVSVRLVLVANNDQIVFTNPNTDPYTNNNGGTMLGQNQTTCDSRIGSANYDIGHVFSTGGGGVAYLGVVCKNGSKAGGVTGLPQPIGDNFYIDYVAHEMGHEFGANHCFNSQTSSCGGGNRSGAHAYEPGSASTIMGYAGICGSDNIQSHSDAYFGSDSFDAIRNYTNNGSGNSCAVQTSTNNVGPTVSAGSAHSIPVGTPFTLTATGSDANGDPLTYCWEERDLGPAATLTTADDGQIPLNRSYTGTADPSRTVPRLATILANSTDKKDRYTEVGRSYVWRVTARDNRAGGGGVATSEVTYTVVSGTGPFNVLTPSGGETWQGQGTVTWNVANTSNAPISATQVTILLSTDNGTTFPYVLAASTPNDGSEVVSIPPNIQTTNARIKVAPTNNVFFDINPGKFSIDYTPPLVITLPNGPVLAMPPGQATDFAVQISPGSENVSNGTEKLFFSYDGGAFTSANLVNQGGGLYTATLPAGGCSDSPRYYLEAKGTGGSTVRLPDNAPTGYFQAAIGDYEVVATNNFETDQGWLVDAGASAGNWERAVPINAGWGDPSGDADGSGKCYVTGNTLFENVDGGTTTLISPAFDLSNGGALGYSYWLSGFPGVDIGPGDGLFVDVATDQFGANWTELRAYTTVEQAWKTDAIAVGVEVPASPTVRIRFRAVDAGSNDTVEAGVDAFSLSVFTCSDTCVADFNGDGNVNTQDVLAFLNAWNAGDSRADINGDGNVNTQDVLAYLNLWNAGC